MRRSNMALEIDHEKHTKTVSTDRHQKIVYSDSARLLSFLLSHLRENGVAIQDICDACADEVDHREGEQSDQVIDELPGGSHQCRQHSFEPSEPVNADERTNSGRTATGTESTINRIREVSGETESLIPATWTISATIHTGRNTKRRCVKPVAVPSIKKASTGCLLVHSFNR